MNPAAEAGVVTKYGSPTGELCTVASSSHAGAGPRYTCVDPHPPATRLAPDGMSGWKPGALGEADGEEGGVGEAEDNVRTVPALVHEAANSAATAMSATTARFILGPLRVRPERGSTWSKAFDEPTV